MVKFVAKKLAVDNSDLSELDGYKPFKNPFGLTIEKSASYKKGLLTVKVKQDGALKYKLSEIDVPKNEINKLFKGDNWEPNLFKGNDTISGSSDADALYGFNGADLVHGNAGDDTVYGGKGGDTLYGDDGVDTIFGGAGKDFLDGGSGTVNSLTGGGGKDTFAFSAALAPGQNYSQIEDMVVGEDKIQLAKDAFVGIGANGTLKAGQFFLASDYAGKAKSVIYDESNGNLYYAKDGGGLVEDALIFGRIGNGAELGNTDFVVA